MKHMAASSPPMSGVGSRANPRRIDSSPAVFPGGRRDVHGSLSNHNLLGHVHVAASRLRCQGLVLVQADLLLGLRRGLEGLPRPAVPPDLKEVLDVELDPLRVRALALGVCALLQVQQAPAHLAQRMLARGHGLQGVAYVHEELARALHDVLLRQHIRLVAERQLLDDRANHLCRQQLPEEQVTDEFHIGEHAALGPRALELELPGVHRGEVLLARLQGGGKCLELRLADVQEHRLESYGLAAVSRRELWEGCLEAEDQVGIGFAIVRLS
mmetsp:Transcript_44532/g.115189  ORF Transcript_44532/g.115189 Transcript_44532/m.115189 type:complete len:270 (-) Transcript_44532:1337-2146(-)